MQVPFARPAVGLEEASAVEECMANGWLTTGPKVKQFEDAFAKRHGASHAVAVNSATSGALLAMAALGIGPGDEVLVPSYTFSGPAMMAHHLGAKVVLVDSEPDDFRMSVEDAARKITSRTRAILPTHFAGDQYDFVALRVLAHQAGLHVIEDSAHCVGSCDSLGRSVGSDGLATATFFSFYATKVMTTGEGGMVLTRDEALANKMRSLALHGMSRGAYARYTASGASWAYDIALPGWKANMTDVAAAIGLAQLGRLERMTATRRSAAASYTSRLSGVPGVTVPADRPGHVWHLYPIRVPAGIRDKLIRALADRGIKCSVHFIPLHHHTVWTEIARGGNSCSNASKLFSEEVSLPLFSYMSAEQVKQVSDAVEDLMKNLTK